MNGYIPPIQIGGSLQPVFEVSCVLPESIQSIVVLRSIEATSLFGTRAGSGAVLIQTK